MVGIIIYNRNSNIGESTRHPAMPNAIITKHTEHANKKAVTKRFFHNFSTICLMKYGFLCNILHTPKNNNCNRKVKREAIEYPKHS